MRHISRFFTCLLMFSFAIAAFYYLSQFCKKQTDGFTILDISSPHVDTFWQTEPPTTDEWQATQAALCQKYFYLSSGGQCYAFASEDGQYVLKFLKHSNYTIRTWFRSLPIPNRLKERLEKNNARSLSRMDRDFNSYKIAWEHLRKETGLLHLQLSSSATNPASVTIVDKLGIAHTLDLNSMPFILQKKAELIYARLNQVMEKNDLASVKTILRTLVQVVVTRCQKGIFDEDAKIHRNFGCLGNETIIIDIGRLRLDPTRKNPAVYHQDLLSMTARFKNWLQEHHPVLLNELNLYIAVREVVDEPHP